jgi:hypothetical protein
MEKVGESRENGGKSVLSGQHEVRRKSGYNGQHTWKRPQLYFSVIENF